MNPTVIFARLLSVFAPEPKLHLLPLGLPLEFIKQQFADVLPVEEESSWSDTIAYGFDLPGYRLIAEVQDGVVKGYVHDTEVYRHWTFQRLRKVDTLLAFYGKESPFRFIMDNGFGVLYRSENGLLRAAYSHMDIFSVSLFELKRKS